MNIESHRITQFPIANVFMKAAAVECSNPTINGYNIITQIGTGG